MNVGEKNRLEKLYFRTDGWSIKLYHALASDACGEKRSITGVIFRVDPVRNTSSDAHVRGLRKREKKKRKLQALSLVGHGVAQPVFTSTPTSKGPTVCVCSRHQTNEGH